MASCIPSPRTMPFTSLLPSWLFRAAFWILCVAVGVLSLSPLDRLPPQIVDIWDKAQHATGFAVLALLGHLGYRRSPMLWIAPGLLAYGAVIEVAQSATGWRQGDVLDWLADAVGVGVGLALAWLAVARDTRRRSDAQ